MGLADDRGLANSVKVPQKPLFLRRVDFSHVLETHSKRNNTEVGHDALELRTFVLSPSLVLVRFRKINDAKYLASLDSA